MILAIIAGNVYIDVGINLVDPVSRVWGQATRKAYTGLVNKYSTLSNL